MDRFGVRVVPIDCLLSQAKQEGFEELDHCAVSLEQLMVDVPLVGELWRSRIWPMICRAVAAACGSVRDSVEARGNSFELFGFGGACPRECC